MALNPSTNPTMAGRVTPVDLDYPYGSAKDETAPGAGDGSPYFKARADDLMGYMQALLRSASIVPTGNADTARASQYVQAQVELAAGRAINYDESGAANAYVLDLRANQQGPAAYFDGLIAEFTVGVTNTAACTVNIAGLGIKNIAGTATAGTLTSGDIVRVRYHSGTSEFIIISNTGSSYLEIADIGVIVQGYDGTLLNAADIGAIIQAYNANTPNAIVSQVDAGAGISTLPKTWTAERVKQAIASLAPSPSNTFGDVGTYAILTHHTSAQLLYAGTDYPGSSLTPTAYSSANSTSNGSGNTVMDGWSGKAFVAGTWRCMGQRSVSGSYAYVSTLFKRIS